MRGAHRNTAGASPRSQRNSALCDVSPISDSHPKLEGSQSWGRRGSEGAVQLARELRGLEGMEGRSSAWIPARSSLHLPPFTPFTIRHLDLSLLLNSHHPAVKGQLPASFWIN